MHRFKIHENLKDNCFDVGQDTLLYLWSKCWDNLKLFKGQKKGLFLEAWDGKELLLDKRQVKSSKIKVQLPHLCSRNKTLGAFRMEQNLEIHVACEKGVKLYKLMKKS